MARTVEELPDDTPDYVRRAVEVFTDDEIAALERFYSGETGEFIGIGFIGPGGKYTRHADPAKAQAIAVLEANLFGFVPEPLVLKENEEYSEIC